MPHVRIPHVWIGRPDCIYWENTAICLDLGSPNPSCSRVSCINIHTHIYTNMLRYIWYPLGLWKQGPSPLRWLGFLRCFELDWLHFRPSLFLPSDAFCGMRFITKGSTGSGVPGEPWPFPPLSSDSEKLLKGLLCTSRRWEAPLNSSSLLIPVLPCAETLMTGRYLDASLLILGQGISSQASGSPGMEGRQLTQRLSYVC